MQQDQEEFNQSPEPEQKPKRKSLSLGCQVFLGLGIFFVLLTGTIGALTWQSYNWLFHAQQDAAVTYAPIVLTATEELGLSKIKEQIKLAASEKRDLDISLSTNQLNAFIQEGAAEEALRDGKSPDKMGTLRFSFEDTNTVIKCTIPDKDQFVNAEIYGDLTIEEGRFTAKLERVVLAGKEAPWMAMTVARYFLNQVQEKPAKLPAEVKKALRAIKLMKREGNKIRLTLNSNELKEMAE